MRYRILTPEEFKGRYKRLKRCVLNATSRGNYTAKVVREKVAQRLILAVELSQHNYQGGVMLLERQGQNLHITAISGDFPKDWPLRTFIWLRELAAIEGMNRLQCQGRRGWNRKLEPLGFRPEGDLLVCDL